MAAVTSAVAFVSKATAEEVAPEPVQPGESATTAGTAAIPAAPDNGLLVLRYDPRPAAPPPAMDRQMDATVAGADQPTTVTSSATAPTPPPPPPRLPTAPAKVQSSGS